MQPAFAAADGPACPALALGAAPGQPFQNKYFNIFQYFNSKIPVFMPIPYAW